MFDGGRRCDGVGWQPPKSHEVKLHGQGALPTIYDLESQLQFYLFFGTVCDLARTLSCNTHTLETGRIEYQASPLANTHERFILSISFWTKFLFYYILQAWFLSMDQYAVARVCPPSTLEMAGAASASWVHIAALQHTAYCICA